MAMYNQFILEELKTLKDLLEAGAITQGEFDHLKQILIDGTRISNETVDVASAETITAGDVYENPEEVIRYYSNETKNLLLYKQFDKAYPFVQKILSLRPDHREANRFLQEIKTFVRRDYLIGGAIGIGLACVFSYVFTLSKDVNFILLCIVPILAGVLLPRLAGNLLIGRVSSRGMRYFISGALVLVVGCTFNILLASGLLASLWLLDNAGLFSLLGWALVGGVLVLTSLVSRALFYVLVIPTTMPGAFFWKNKGFEQHARDIGLANMSQVGVAQLRH